MEDMINYVLKYFDRDIDNKNTINKFIRGRKLISIYNNTHTTNFKSMNDTRTKMFKNTISDMGTLRDPIKEKNE